MTKEANVWNRNNSAWRQIVDSATVALNLSPGEASFTVKAGSLSVSDVEERAIVWIVDSGILDMTTGVKGYVEVPFDCTIVSGSLLADATGSVVVDVWKDTYANAPPTDADSITSSAPLTISAATKSKDTTLTGWDKDITSGDVLAFNVDSVSGIKRVTITLKVTVAKVLTNV